MLLDWILNLKLVGRMSTFPLISKRSSGLGRWPHRYGQRVWGEEGSIPFAQMIDLDSICLYFGETEMCSGGLGGREAHEIPSSSPGTVQRSCSPY